MKYTHGKVGNMDPSMVDRIMDRFESGHPMSQDRGTPIVGLTGPLNPLFGHQVRMASRPNPFENVAALRDGFRMRMRPEVSAMRAKIAAMVNDTVSAALWALSGFDPALVHLAELREHFIHLTEEDPLRAALDRLCSVYVEGQCRELLIGAGITTEEADFKVEQAIQDSQDVIDHVLACTDDPLAMELTGYAMWLGSLTAHGTAPWNRFTAVMADCYHQRQPAEAAS